MDFKSFFSRPSDCLEDNIPFIFSESRFTKICISEYVRLLFSGNRSMSFGLTDSNKNIISRALRALAMSFAVKLHWEHQCWTSQYELFKSETVTANNVARTLRDKSWVWNSWIYTEFQCFFILCIISSTSITNRSKLSRLPNVSKPNISATRFGKLLK